MERGGNAGSEACVDDHSVFECDKFIDRIRSMAVSKRLFFSFEYFPPKTSDGLVNLLEKIDRMGKLEPLFVDITWSTANRRSKEELISIEIAAKVQNLCLVDCNVHLVCSTLNRQEIVEALKKCKESGIRNVLALRGDYPLYTSNTPREFKYAKDLVELIRSDFGDYFGVSVAGYPYSHPESPSYEMSIVHLKEKVDAGADFVISQLFFSSSDYFKWVKDCRDCGITCPIIPGILPLQDYDSLRKITKMCNSIIPGFIYADIEPIKNDCDQIREYSIEFTTKICRELIEGGVPGIHFYTLNREIVVKEVILRLTSIGELNLHLPNPCSRSLPFRTSCACKRVKECVRPIFWSHRPKSYVARTYQWTEYPNGRWGDLKSSAFGELKVYHLFLQKSLTEEYRRSIWGELITSLEDVGNVFISYLLSKIDKLPWFDEKVSLETREIIDDLIKLNRKGFFTINSQPNVNASPSEDLAFGWGPSNGHVYQKAYVEFFTSEEKLQRLLKKMNLYGSRFKYQAVNQKGDCIKNYNTTIAVTWGVFPQSEIKQPTVVDPAAFLVWKGEAFELWTEAWASIYPTQSESRKILEHIQYTYFLVNIIDNDFINGNIFELFNTE